jgi:hypothetical protein
MDALRRGDADARLAARHEVLVCAAVEASGEYDAREPHTARSWRIEKAVARFREVFGRLPSSVCPPDYRWNEQLEQDLERLSVTTIQGKGEQHGASRGPLTRRLLAPHGIRVRGRRFYLPARIAFEPAVEGAGSSRLGAEAAHRAVRAAWRRGQPAVVSTHRHNLVHLDAARAERGRDALRGLLSRLCEDGAVFLVDREVRELVERGWSAREIGERGVLVRRHAEAPRTIRLPAPADARQVHVRNGRVESATIERGEAHVRLGEGEALFEWERV